MCPTSPQYSAHVDVSNMILKLLHLRICGFISSGVNGRQIGSTVFRQHLYFILFFSKILDTGLPTCVLPPGWTWRKLLHSPIALSSFLFLLYAATRASPAPFFVACRCGTAHPERTHPLSARQRHARLGCSSACSPPRDAWRATPPSLPPSLPPQRPLRASMPPECGRQWQLPARRARLPPSPLSVPRSLTSIHPETMTASWLR